MPSDRVNHALAVFISTELAQAATLRNAQLDGADNATNWEASEKRKYAARRALLLSTDERIERNQVLKSWGLM